MCALGRDSDAISLGFIKISPYLHFNVDALFVSFGFGFSLAFVAIVLQFPFYVFGCARRIFFLFTVLLSSLFIRNMSVSLGLICLCVMWNYV